MELLLVLLLRLFSGSSCGLSFNFLLFRHLARLLLLLFHLDVLLLCEVDAGQVTRVLNAPLDSTLIISTDPVSHLGLGLNLLHELR